MCLFERNGDSSSSENLRHFSFSSPSSSMCEIGVKKFFPLLSEKKNGWTHLLTCCATCYHCRCWSLLYLCKTWQVSLPTKTTNIGKKTLTFYLDDTMFQTMFQTMFRAFYDDSMSSPSATTMSASDTHTSGSYIRLSCKSE